MKKYCIVSKQTYELLERTFGSSVIYCDIQCKKPNEYARVMMSPSLEQYYIPEYFKELILYPTPPPSLWSRIKSWFQS